MIYNGMRNKTNLSISIALMGLYCSWSLLVNRSFSPTLPRINNQIKVFKRFEKISKWSQWGAQLNGSSIYSPAVHLFGIFSCVYKNFMDISWISLAPRGKISFPTRSWFIFWLIEGSGQVQPDGAMTSGKSLWFSLTRVMRDETGFFWKFKK